MAPSTWMCVDIWIDEIYLGTHQPGDLAHDGDPDPGRVADRQQPRDVDLGEEAGLAHPRAAAQLAAVLRARHRQLQHRGGQVAARGQLRRPRGQRARDAVRGGEGPADLGRGGGAYHLAQHLVRGVSLQNGGKDKDIRNNFVPFDTTVTMHCTALADLEGGGEADQADVQHGQVHLRHDVGVRRLQSRYEYCRYYRYRYDALDIHV